MIERRIELRIRRETFPTIMSKLCKHRKKKLPYSEKIPVELTIRIISIARPHAAAHMHRSFT